MLYSELQEIAGPDLFTDLPILPATTPIEDKYDRRPMKKTSFKYPGRSKTKKFNVAQRRRERAELTKRFYSKVLAYRTSMSNKEKQTMRRKIMDLRPSIASLKKHYLKRGDSREVVDKIVTPRNYPELPNVWITKRQQAVLLAALENKEQKFQDFINNGFY